ncbi:MAG: tetratricopeptide repeat protein [Bacteroidales bacterium]|nr:tetratricopeptide repeat protein [Bacteroidales bacterium]
MSLITHVNRRLVHYYLYGILMAVLSLQLIPQFSWAQTPQPENALAESVDDYIALSKIYLKRSTEKALEHCNTAIILARKAHNDTLLASAYKNKGVIHYYLTEQSDAILYFDSAMVLMKKLSNKQELSNVYNNLGILYGDLGQHTKAIDYFLVAMQLKDSIKDSIGMGHCTNNIGALYYEMNSLGDALAYFKKAFSIASDLNDFEGMLSAINNIGLIEMDLDSLPKALASFRASIVIADSIRDVGGKANSMHNIGNIHLAQKAYDSALYYFDCALSGYVVSEKMAGKTYNGKGQVYFELGQFQRATEFFRLALKAAGKANDDQLKLKVLHNLFETYSKLNQTDQAFGYLIQYHDLFQSIRTLFDSTAIQNLQARFMVDKKLAEIEDLKKERLINDKLMEGQLRQIKSQRAFLHLSLLAATLLLVLLAIVFRLNKRLKKSGWDLAHQNDQNKQAKEQLSLANTALSEQKNLLLTLINSTPDIICFKDGNGRWLEANHADIELFRLTGVDYRYKTDAELAVYTPFFKEAMETCLITDEITWQKRTVSRGDEVIPQPDGPSRVFDVIKVPVFNEQGERDGLIVLGRDITERKKTEEALGKALTKAEESDRLKSAFLTNMSHEIRTPLNAIIGFSDLLNDPEINDEEHDHFVKLINENGHSLLRLIGDILDLSRIEAGEMKLNFEQKNLNNVFSEVYNNYSTLLFGEKKSTVNFKLQIPEKGIHLQIDELRLKQIITNLLNNAFKFTDKGEVEFGYELQREKLHMWVKDTGIGIPEDKRDVIFKRFVKLNDDSRRVYPGTGLGLSIVGQFVRLMGGLVWFDSKAAVGTVFHITLPVISPTEENEEPVRSQRKVMYDFSGKCILIVEDVESNFELLKVLIEPTSAKIMRAVDGQQAVDICMSDPSIDLVLMDIQLPVIDGYEATRLIKERNPFLPIIAQTAYALVEEKEACFTAGCDGYIAKPIRSSFLLPVIDELIDLKPKQ